LLHSSRALHSRDALTCTLFSYLWYVLPCTGKGICRFPGGQEYEGTYKNGLREGRGTVTFAEGAVYEGRFKVYLVL
jgi:hypothetical protein